MADIIDFGARAARPQLPAAGPDILRAAPSLEVMPRTASKVERFDALLPRGAEVFVAHIDGTSHDDMVATVRRLREEGMEPVPHVPARSMPDRAALTTLLARYADEAGVRRALLLAGGAAGQAGPFDSSMALVETGLFDAAGFEALYVAGHPEGCREVDPDGGEAVAMAALRWKQGMAARTGARVEVVTQFAFDAEPIVDWSMRVAAAGVDLPVRIGVAGPAKLQTLIKYAMACGVGPSIQVLRKRAADLTALMRPFSPAPFVADLSRRVAATPGCPITGLHVFPLGGIAASASYVCGVAEVAEMRGEGSAPQA